MAEVGILESTENHWLEWTHIISGLVVEINGHFVLVLMDRGSIGNRVILH